MQEAIIFGASTYGKIAYEKLKHDYELIFFADNDEKKWNQRLYNLEVLNIKGLHKFRDTLIIIASMNWEEIGKQLDSHGFTNLRVFFYYGNFHEAPLKSGYKVYTRYSQKEYESITLEDCLNEPGNNLAQAEISDDNPKNPYQIAHTEKDVLFVTYHFPPTGGTGVQRSTKFCKYLPDYGWNPIIITTNDITISQKDESLTHQVAKDATIIRMGKPIPNSNLLDADSVKDILKLMSHMISENDLQGILSKIQQSDFSSLRFVYKNSAMYWAKEVIKRLPEYINYKKIKAVYTTAPPYEALMIGYYLKKMHDIPWIIDLRDEWISNPFFQPENELEKCINYTSEKVLFTRADRVINLSSSAANSMQKRLGTPQNKLITIPNGYDENDFEGMNLLQHKNEKFTIIHNGHFFNSVTKTNHRIQPDTFFEAIRKLINEQRAFAEEVTVLLNQPYTDWIMELVKRYSLESVVNFQGYLEHQDSLKSCFQADLLLCVAGAGKEARNVYTGKVFEYLRINKPILALAPKEGVLDELLRETRRGICVEYNHIDEIKEALFVFYEEWKNGDKENELDHSIISKFNRKNQTQKLAETLTELTSK